MSEWTVEVARERLDAYQAVVDEMVEDRSLLVLMCRVLLDDARHALTALAAATARAEAAERERDALAARAEQAEQCAASYAAMLAGADEALLMARTWALRWKQTTKHIRRLLHACGPALSREYELEKERDALAARLGEAEESLRFIFDNSLDYFEDCPTQWRCNYCENDAKTPEGIEHWGKCPHETVRAYRAAHPTQVAIAGPESALRVPGGAESTSDMAGENEG